ncbi:uncharacterized protein SPSC_03818 [Sporisorium scitamineum]|uniref:Uncharacterized protein n=1 Tax=Sporisorium scitamineum TaxID=49012 RepID=A0A127Z2V1_9BASI|nr:uncharacterized protein SPSC_03818 [Sporisorium scitamineum]
MDAAAAMLGTMPYVRQPKQGVNKGTQASAFRIHIPHSCPVAGLSCGYIGHTSDQCSTTRVERGVADQCALCDTLEAPKTDSHTSATCPLTPQPLAHSSRAIASTSRARPNGSPQIHE